MNKSNFLLGRQQLRKLLAEKPEASAKEALDMLQRYVFSWELKLPSDTVVFVDPCVDTDPYLEVFREGVDGFTSTLVIFDANMTGDQIKLCKSTIFGSVPAALRTLDFYLQLRDHEDFIMANPKLSKPGMDQNGGGITADVSGRIVFRLAGAQYGDTTQSFEVAKVWNHFMTGSLLAGCAGKHSHFPFEETQTVGLVDLGRLSREEVIAHLKECGIDITKEELNKRRAPLATGVS